MFHVEQQSLGCNIQKKKNKKILWNLKHSKGFFRLLIIIHNQNIIMSRTLKNGLPESHKRAYKTFCQNAKIKHHKLEKKFEGIKETFTPLFADGYYIKNGFEQFAGGLFAKVFNKLKVKYPATTTIFDESKGWNKYASWVCIDFGTMAAANSEICQFPEIWKGLWDGVKIKGNVLYIDLKYIKHSKEFIYSYEMVEQPLENYNKKFQRKRYHYIEKWANVNYDDELAEWDGVGVIKKRAALLRIKNVRRYW